MRFLDLCDKEVININNCCYLGHVRDMEFDQCTGCICAIIVPGPGKYMGCFCREEEYVIPWCNIVRIGPDIVLVNLKDEMRHKIQWDLAEFIDKFYYIRVYLQYIIMRKLAESEVAL